MGLSHWHFLEAEVAALDHTHGPRGEFELLVDQAGHFRSPPFIDIRYPRAMPAALRIIDPVAMRGRAF
jgi:hypothetical protein